MLRWEKFPAVYSPPLCKLALYEHCKGARVDEKTTGILPVPASAAFRLRNGRDRGGQRPGGNSGRTAVCGADF